MSLWPAFLLATQIGFYQWVGAPPESHGADLLTQARLRATAAGAKVFRFYLGPRYDYLHHVGHGGQSPAQMLARASYRTVLEDPKIDTVILTTYTALDYGAGPDDLNLLRPWDAAAEQAERTQIRELCGLLFSRFGKLPKTIVIANSEADDKMLEILNYTGSSERAIANLTAWTNARHAAIEQSRALHPDARLRVLHGFEISLANLRIARQGSVFRKSPAGTWNALRDIVPKIRFDLLLYSAYESINSPFETQNIDVDPAETGARLLRDLDRVRHQSRSSLSATGRRLFGDRFIALGEVGLARDRFERLATGGVLPRLLSAIQAARQWGCPYIVLWQVFDAPRAGGEPYGYGMIDRYGRAPRLRPAPSGCDSILACLQPVLALQ